MAGVRRFQDLICYQLARELRRTIRRLIKTNPLATDFNLCDQMRRAARSATGNIAEGFKCRSNTEFARFLEVSARSLSEIEDRLIETRDSEILTEEQAAPAFNLEKRASVAVARLITHLRSTDSRPPGGRARKPRPARRT